MERYIEQRFERIEKDIRDMDDQINVLEKISEGRSKQIEGYLKEIRGLEKQLDRLENTLLNEFKISQGILKSMVENEWEIDRAKLDLKQETERKKQELEGQQRSFEIETMRERRAMKKDIYIKVATIFLPILTALATGISLLIQKLF